MTQLIQDHQAEIEQVIRENNINYLALYGSYARGEQTSKSDVDLLLNFDKTASKGLFDLVKIERQLSKLLQRKVDLVTKNSINKYIKPYIQDDIQVIYAEKS